MGIETPDAAIVVNGKTDEKADTPADAEGAEDVHGECDHGWNDMDDEHGSDGAYSLYELMHVLSSPHEEPVIENNDKYDMDPWDEFTELVAQAASSFKCLALGNGVEYKAERKLALLWLGANPSAVRSLLFAVTLDGQSYPPQYRRPRDPAISSVHAELHRHFVSEVCREFVFDEIPKSDTLDQETAHAISIITPVLADAYMAFLDDIYRTKQNAVYAWLAYSASRKLKRPLPEWAAGYFDTCAQRVEDFIECPPSHISSVIPAALELTDGKKGAGSPFKDESQRRLDVKVFLFAFAHGERGDKVKDVEEKARKEFNIEPGKFKKSRVVVENELSDEIEKRARISFGGKKYEPKMSLDDLVIQRRRNLAFFWGEKSEKWKRGRAVKKP